MGLLDIFTKKEENKVPTEQTQTPQAVVNMEPLTQEIPKDPNIAEQTVLSTNAIVENPQPVLNEQADLKVDLNEVFEGGMTKEDEITQIVSEQVNPSPVVEEIPSLAVDNPFQEAQTKEESVEEIAPTIPGENPFVETELVEPTPSEIPSVQETNQEAQIASPMQEASSFVEKTSVESTPSEFPSVEEANQIVEIAPTIQEENPFAEDVPIETFPSEVSSSSESTQVVENASIETEDNSAEEIAPVLPELVEEISPVIEENNENILPLEESATKLEQENNNSLEAPSLEESEEISLPVIIEEEPQLVIIDSTGEENVIEKEEENVLEVSEEENEVTEQIQIAQDIMPKEEEKIPIRFCENCGELINSYAAVCPNCGEPID